MRWTNCSKGEGGESLLALLASLALLAPACAKVPPVVAAPASPPSLLSSPPSPEHVLSTASGDALRADLARTFASPEVDHALWAVKVQSMETDEVFYSLNPRTLVMPASNMKIITTAVAAERLGWDYRYETQLLASGPVERGRLRGDLIVRGSGDPTINAPTGEKDEKEEQGSVFDAWADQLRAAGINGIDGRIIGDDDAFDDEGRGKGWAWDDLPYGYATPGGALLHHDNVVELVVQAGRVPGAPVSIELRPTGSGLVLVNRVMTSPTDGDFTLQLRRMPGQPTLAVTGRVPAGTEPFTQTASVDNPTEFFVRALRETFVSHGIEVNGPAVDVDTIAAARGPENQDHRSDIPVSGSVDHVLVSHLSPPLSEIATALMKPSQNLYAETLLKTVGAGAGPGTTEAGRESVREVLTAWGIPPDAYIIADGSGLSRYNYVTAGALVTVLQKMHDLPRHAAAFEATLPLAGRDGTLDSRMKGTLAEGNVRAKTGFLANVRALSGYVSTRDDELVAFAIIANNFDVPPQVIDDLIDRAVERLANFSRD